jgi:two-component system OmpR family sensor kinase
MSGRSRPVASDAVLVGRAARRLGAQAAVLVALVVVVLTGVAALVMLQGQQRSAAALLDGAITGADDVEDPPVGVFLVIRRGQELAATAGLPPGAQDTAAIAAVGAGAVLDAEDRHVGGKEYRVSTVRRADGSVVQGVLDLSENHAERNRLLAMMGGAGGIGLLLAAAVGTWLGRRALRPLSAALAVQRRFVADAGHELRTPLTLLGTRAQLLRRRLRRASVGAVEPPSSAEPGPPLLADLDGIVADADRLTEILEDLLLAADPLAERPREPVDLVGLGRSTVDAAAATALEGGVDLLGPQHVDPVIVLGSAVALRRALTALLDNAVRHADRTVVVRVAATAREAVLDVTDDGPGVDPALAGRLFDRFASTRPRTGPRRYGLGLALVAEIIAAHSGRVELLGDRTGTGTTVRVTLPLDPARPGPRT